MHLNTYSALNALHKCYKTVLCFLHKRARGSPKQQGESEKEGREINHFDLATFHINFKQMSVIASEERISSSLSDTEKTMESCLYK